MFSPGVPNLGYMYPRGTFAYMKIACNEMVDIWNTSWESHKLTKNRQK